MPGRASPSSHRRRGCTVTVPVECPHCASVFQLGADLAGKSMRCPNPDCREVFQVQPQAAPVLPPTHPDLDAPVPEPSLSGGVSDFLTVVEAEPARDVTQVEVTRPDHNLPFERVESADYVPTPVRQQIEPSVFELPAPDPSVFELPPPDTSVFTLPEPDSAPPTGKKKSRPADVPVAKFAPKKSSGPKQVSWNASPPPGPTPFAEPARPRIDDENDDGVFERRTTGRRRWPKLLLAVLLFGVGGLVTFIGVGALTIGQRTETALAAEAKEAYEKGKYQAAAELYQKAATSFPLSPSRDEYEFFAALADARAAADGVLTREDPSAARAKLDGFLTAFGDSPYARPDVTYGGDVAQLGRKVADALADFGAGRVAQFRADRNKNEPLDVAEKAAADGTPLLAGLEKFRGKDSPGFDDQRKKFADVAAAVRKERDRLAILAPFRGLADDPTDESIEEAEAKFRQTGLSDDAEAKSLVALAKEALRKLIRATAAGKKPVRPPADLNPPVLFAAAPLGSPEPRPSPDFVPDVVFAAARGVLYALDAESGKPLWGTRVGGGPTGDPRLNDVPVRFAASEGGPEWVLVPSESNGQRGVAAHVARTGEVVWYQPLDAPLAGRPAVVGRRAYIPLADPHGTVVEIQLSTGSVVNQVPIRQHIGAGLVGSPGSHPGSGYLFVPADARRVFVFEVGKEAADGTREPPRLIRIVSTEHPRESLRGEPLLVTPPVGDGPRYLILPQTDGPEKMKLRCFPLPADLTGPWADGNTAAVPAAEVEVKGWSWYPPATDGEHVVAATDAGSVAVFGVNQVGNTDKPLFSVPAPAPTGDPEAVNRALVVAVDEDSAWVVVGGKLTRLRTALDPAGGLRVIPDGRSEPVGEPAHRAQIRPASGLGVVVTGGGSAAGRATAFDLGTGQVRWQRQLGAVAAAAPIGREGKPTLLADEAGGVYAVPTEDRDAAVFAVVLAPPVKDPLGKVHVARSADAGTVWVLIPEGTEGNKRLRVRKVVDGTTQPDVTAPLPDQLAGPPVVAGDSLLVPLRDGAVYRIGSVGLTKGPVWRVGANPDAVGFLASAGGDEFLATDGADDGAGVIRWSWPAGGKPTKRGGPWRTNGGITAPPAVLGTGDELRFAVADATGAVRVFEPGKGEEPVGQWSGGSLPLGPAGDRLDVLTVGGKPRLVYAAARRHMVCLDPDAEAPVWVTRGPAVADSPEVIGWATVGGRLVVTDQSARLTVIDLTTGKQLPDVPVGVAGVAVAEVVPAGGGRGLLALADGTVVAVPMPK